MNIDFSLDDSTREDIIALATLRLRSRLNREDAGEAVEALELWEQQDKLEEIVHFYLQIFEMEPTNSWGDELAGVEQIERLARSVITHRQIPRPVAVTAATFRFFEVTNSLMAETVTCAVRELFRFDSQVRRWGNE